MKLLDRKLAALERTPAGGGNESGARVGVPRPTPRLTRPLGDIQWYGCHAS